MQQAQPHHDGRLALPSNDNGNRFASRQASDVAGEEGRASGVLIVEDDFLIGMQTESALVDAGIAVVGVAATAEEAILLARQHKPALAVMDIRLAGRRDGVDAAAELFRELGIRCIFATAHDDQRTRSRAEPFAPLGWLAKPYTMASLIDYVRRALREMK
jgi:two-component system, response regulator PdtaR